MEYSQAKNIRRTGLGTLIRNRMLDNNQSIAKSVVGSISDKFKAKLTGIQEKLDPLNLAKKLTGGSNLAPALLGKMTGRKLSTIRYFTGGNDKKTYKSLGPLPTSGGDNTSLSQLYKFMVKAHEQDKRRYAIEKSFREEQRNEDQKNHEQFLEVIKMYTRLPLTVGGETTVVQQKAEIDESGILSTITEKITSIVSWITNMFSRTGPIALFAEKIYSWFKENIAKSIGNFLKNNILKYLTKTVMLSALKTVMGMGWRILMNPITLAFLAAGAAAWGLEKLKHTQTGIKARIGTQEKELLSAEQNLESYRKRGLDDSHYLVVGAKKRISDAKSKLDELTVELQNRAQLDLLEEENNKKDGSLLGRLTSSIQNMENGAEESISDFPIFNPLGEHTEEEKTVSKLEGMPKSTEGRQPFLDQGSANRVVKLPPPARNMALAKVIDESNELQLKSDMLGVSSVTGSPLVLNNTNTSKLPDRKPSSSPNVRDMSPRVGDAFSYLKKAQRSY